jgi:hypothetical protein
VIVAFSQGGFNDAMVAINGAQIVALIGIGIYLSKVSERLARLEEARRQQERKENHVSSDKG